MCDKVVEDNESMHSEDSFVSTTTALKESLENSVTKNIKDFRAYHDLELRNRILKLEEENVRLSCRRLESQIKKRNERLEELHEKLRDCLQNNNAELKKQLSTVQTDLEKVNTLFSTAFEKYSSNFERNLINEGHQEIKEQETKLKKLNNEMAALQQKEKFADSFMKSQASERARSEQVTEKLSDFLLNRPDIKLEEEYNALVKTNNQLEARLNVLKSLLKIN